MTKELFDADYFLRGPETGKSLYSNYTWKESLTIPMVQRMIDHLGIDLDDTILDFGCARGYTVKAFRGLGFEAYGVDVSEWAIANADDEVKPFLFRTESRRILGGKIGPLDWIIAKDVLEHIPQCADTINDLMDAAGKGVFAVVPLSPADGSPYVVPDYEKDCTHVHRLTLATWARMFMRPGWTVECSYSVQGIKQNYAEWKDGNGFIVARRQ